MKKFFITIAIIVITMINFSLNAQNVGIGSSNFTPDNSAGLEIKFTDKGLLIPRVALTSTTDATTIPSPATSLLVYNLGTGGLSPAGYYYWDGSQWVKFATGTGAGITSIGPGTSGSETSGSGLTFSANPITTTGTIALSNSGVTAGTYGSSGANIPNITVDARGRLTSAANRALSYSDVGAASSTHTHTQLHNQLHSMISTSDHSANSWKIFYSNASGYVQELALGGSGTYLMSNGTSSAPTWATPSVSETDPTAWKITGNSNITDGTHFLGTTNNVPLTFKINNTKAGRIATNQTFLGYMSGNSATGIDNSYFGVESGYSTTTATENTFIGRRAGYFLQTGSSNVAIGFNALYCYGGAGSGPFPGGIGNVAIGKWAMFNPTSGDYNVAVGYSTYSLPHTGSYNVFIGYYADGEILYNPSNSVGLGAYSKVRGSNAVAIGYRAYAIYDNTIVLGGINGVNSATVTSSVGIGTNDPQATLHVRAYTTGLTGSILTNNGGSYHNDWPEGWGGGIGTWDISCAGVYYSSLQNRSDFRYKKNIETIDFNATDKLMLLRPVSYQYIDSLEEPGLRGKKYHYGFIAQEYEKVFPTLVSEDTKGYKGISTVELIPILVKAIQEQQKTIEQQQKTTDEQKDMINDLNERITKLEELIKNK